MVAQPGVDHLPNRQAGAFGSSFHWRLDMAHRPRPMSQVKRARQCTARFSAVDDVRSWPAYVRSG